MLYVGFGPEAGTGIEEKQAYQYALERCLNGTPEEQQEFREMLVEWYFSGNWVKEDQDEEQARIQAAEGFGN